MVHGFMVYTERAEKAAVSCGTSHAIASAVNTPLWRIFFKKQKEKLNTREESHASIASLHESGE